MYKKKNTDLSYKFDAQYMYFTMFTHFNKSHPPPKKNKKFQLLKKRTSMKFWN